MSNKTIFLLFIFGPLGFFISLWAIGFASYLIAKIVWPSYPILIPLIFYLSIILGLGIFIISIYFFFTSSTPNFLLFLDDIWWLIGGLAIIACFFILLGYAPIRQPLRLWTTGFKAQAVVEEIDDRFVDYTFENSYGIRYLSGNHVSKNLADSLEKGSQITIYYDPKIKPYSPIRHEDEYAHIGVGRTQIQQDLLQEGIIQTTIFFIPILFSYGLFFLIGIFSYVKYEPDAINVEDHQDFLTYGANDD